MKLHGQKSSYKTHFVVRVVKQGMIPTLSVKFHMVVLINVCIFCPRRISVVVADLGICLLISWASA